MEKSIPSSQRRELDGRVTIGGKEQVIRLRVALDMNSLPTGLSFLEILPSRLF